MTREEQMMTAADAYAAGAYADEPVCFSTEEAICETINDFVAGWRAADSHPQWIPVEEELPKEENAYLVSDGDGVLYGYFIEGRWAPTELNETCTHWMPLPAAPRKEDKK